MTHAITTATSARHVARAHIVQALYQFQLNAIPVTELQTEFIARADETMDHEFFADVLPVVIKDIETLNQMITDYADRPIGQLDPIERAILWLGLYELTDRPDVPMRVVINEAIELAKTYGGEDGHKYINAVLDKAAKKLRAEDAA